MHYSIGRENHDFFSLLLHCRARLKICIFLLWIKKRYWAEECSRCDVTMEARKWILENVQNTISKPLGIINYCNSHICKLKVYFECHFAIIIFVNWEFLFELSFITHFLGMESRSIFIFNLFKLQNCFTTDSCKLSNLKKEKRRDE